jgi:hypothetical protein
VFAFTALEALVAVFAFTALEALVAKEAVPFKLPVKDPVKDPVVVPPPPPPFKANEAVSAYEALTGGVEPEITAFILDVTKVKLLSTCVEVKFVD